MEMKWSSWCFQADLVVFSPAEAWRFFQHLLYHYMFGVLETNSWRRTASVFPMLTPPLTCAIQSYFVFGVAGVFGDRHPTGEEADPSLQLFRGWWTDGVLRVGQRLGGEAVSDTSPGRTQPAVPACRVLQSGKELAHLWVYIQSFTSPSSLVSF